MMPTLSGGPPASLPTSQQPDGFFDDWNTRLALSQAARRLSRGSNGQRPGSAMRVVKPTSASSASNSPRSSMVLGRRRTLIDDGQGRRHAQPTLDRLLIPHGFDAPQPAKRSARPVSWHPGSHLQPPPSQFQQTSYYQSSTPNMYTDQQDVYSTYPYLSPMLASYSTNTSPSSAFSPLSLPFQNADNTHYLPAEGWELIQRSTPFYPTPNSTQDLAEPFPALYSGATQEGTPATNELNWQNYIMHGVNNTSPPTPDSFLQPEPSQPVVSEESMAYQPLDEPEEEGEILVGMGLYDAPDKSEEDPQLNNYRSTVSSLLGSRFRSPEAKGKGLKLEETWSPPKSEDEEEDDDESDEATAEQETETETTQAAA